MKKIYNLLSLALSEILWDILKEKCVKNNSSNNDETHHCTYLIHIKSDTKLMHSITFITSSIYSKSFKAVWQLQHKFHKLKQQQNY